MLFLLRGKTDIPLINARSAAGDSKHAFGLRFQRLPSELFEPMDDEKAQCSDAADFSCPNTSSACFPPGFVLRLPAELVKMARSIDMSFSSVKCGIRAVHMVMREYLHVFMELDPYGAALDVVAFYEEGNEEATVWLQQVLRLIRLVIRDELQRAHCPMRHQQYATETFCCHYHHAVSPDLPECRAVPLCPKCLLHVQPECCPLHPVTEETKLSSSSLSLPNGDNSAGALQRGLYLPYCKPLGHTFPVELTCGLQRKPLAAVTNHAQLLHKLDEVKSSLDALQVHAVSWYLKRHTASIMHCLSCRRNAWTTHFFKWRGM